MNADERGSLLATPRVFLAHARGALGGVGTDQRSSAFICGPSPSFPTPRGMKSSLLLVALALAAALPAQAPAPPARVLTLQDAITIAQRQGQQSRAAQNARDAAR